MQTKPICDYQIFVIKRGIYKNCSRKANKLTIAIPPRERPCFRRRPRMSPSFCFAFSTTATAISTTLVDFPSAHPLPLRTIQRPSFFRAGCCGAREMNRGTPMDFFSVPREHPLCPAPLARNVLRAAATTGSGPKKIQLPICKVGGLFNCDIQFLLAIHLFFSSFSHSSFLSLSLSLFLSHPSHSRFSRRRDGS